MYEYILAAFLFGQAVGMGVVARYLALSGIRTSQLPQWLGRLGLMVALLGMLMALGPVWKGFWVLGALGYFLFIVWILSLGPALWWPRRTLNYSGGLRQVGAIHESPLRPNDWVSKPPT